MHYLQVHILFLLPGIELRTLWMSGKLSIIDPSSCDYPQDSCLTEKANFGLWVMTSHSCIHELYL